MGIRYYYIFKHSFKINIMNRSLRVVLEKEVKSTRDLYWGAAITRLFFLEDGSAWASNHEYATQIWYNPFTGEKLSLENAEGYIKRPAYLIGKTCESMKVENKVLSLVADGVNYEIAIPQSEKINSLLFPNFSKILNRKIKDVSNLSKNSPYLAKTIPKTNGSWHEQRLVFLVDGDVEVEFVWTIESLGYKDFQLVEV
jgi:hypothetical protein